MNTDMIELVRKLEAFSDWSYEKGGVPPVYKSALKEAIVRLVAMDAQIVKLQARASDASYAEDELAARNERERLSGNNYGGL